jgi:hypothetical protein
VLAWVLVLSAAAADLRTGLLWPSAENGPDAAPSVSLGLGAGMALDPQWLGLGFVEVDAIGGGGRVSGSVPLGERVAVGLGATWGGPPRPFAVFPGVQGRWTAAAGKLGALGLFAGVAALPTESIPIRDGRGAEPRTLETRAASAIGAAARLRIGEWTLDAALPGTYVLFTVERGEGTPVILPVARPRLLVAATEVRVSYDLSELWSVFAAAESALPCVGTRLDRGVWAVESAFCSTGALNGLGAEVTWRP